MSNIEPEDQDESGIIMLIQQYASKFGITFSSVLMDKPEAKTKLMRMMMEAISGKRGPVTDDDILNEDPME